MSEEENRAILVKSGGFSTQLETHVGTIESNPLWGAHFDAKNPEAVVQTHLDFLTNGAQIILSNTYQASVEGFMSNLDYTEEQSIELIKKSVRLAKQAVEKYHQMSGITGMKNADGLPLVMASIGPYGAYLHDGSEYTGSYMDTTTKEELQNWHRPRITACLQEGVDGLAIETIPCRMEAEALTDMILNDFENAKFWITFQCKDRKHLASGESFAFAVRSIWRKVKCFNATDRLYGIGVNCVQPEYVSILLQTVHDYQGVDTPPLIVYSNSGETYNSKTNQWLGAEDCKPLETFLEDWINLGAKIIGGCCRVYPKDIKKIRERIDFLANK